MKPIVPANGPMPPIDGDGHAEPQRDHAAPDGVDAEQRHDDPADAVRPAEDGRRRPRAAARARRPGASGRSPSGRRSRYLSCSNVIRPSSSMAAIARSDACASPGHAAGSAGHQACASCSGSGVTAAPGRQPRLADEHHEPVGQADERLDVEPLGLDRPLLLELARERDAPGPRRPPPRRRRRAPSARPRSRPTARAGRRASGPSASRTAHSTESEPCASSCEQPQRPAHGLELDGEPRRRRARSRRGGRRRRRARASRGPRARRPRRRPAR